MRADPIAEEVQELDLRSLEVIEGEQPPMIVDRRAQRIAASARDPLIPPAPDPTEELRRTEELLNARAEERRKDAARRMAELRQLQAERAREHQERLRAEEQRRQESDERRRALEDLHRQHTPRPSPPGLETPDELRRRIAQEAARRQEEPRPARPARPRPIVDFQAPEPTLVPILTADPAREAKPEPRPAPRPEPKIEARAERPEPKIEARAEIRPAPKAETKPEIKPEIKPEPPKATPSPALAEVAAEVEGARTEIGLRPEPSAPDLARPETPPRAILHADEARDLSDLDAPGVTGAPERAAEKGPGKWTTARDGAPLELPPPLRAGWAEPLLDSGKGLTPPHHQSPDPAPSVLPALGEGAPSSRADLPLATTSRPPARPQTPPPAPFEAAPATPAPSDLGDRPGAHVEEMAGIGVTGADRAAEKGPGKWTQGGRTAEELQAALPFGESRPMDTEGPPENPGRKWALALFGLVAVALFVGLRLLS